MKRAFVYVTDECGFKLARHSAASLALSQSEPCDIHIFCYKFSPRDPPRLSDAMDVLRANLVFHDIGDTAVEEHQTHGHVTTPTLLKPLAVGKLVNNYDRIVYLDNDILVFDDLRTEMINFGRTPIAAVIDMDVSDTGWLRHSTGYRDVGGTSIGGGYFNAGVMVFETKNFDLEEINRKYADALHQHDIACRYKVDCTSIDQCALNVIFENNWTRLPVSYNMQAGAKFTLEWKTTMVRHYCGTRKFLPVSLFRNDGRDVRCLNRIGLATGLPVTRYPSFYEFLFQVNTVRKYRGDAPIRQLLRALLARNLAATVQNEVWRTGVMTNFPGPR
jgi:lipopolysaccharide biosynthesis glycosyltransferase